MIRAALTLFGLAVAAGLPVQAQPEPRPAVRHRPAAGPRIGSCPVFPADNVWNTPIDGLAPHPRSALLVNTIGADKPLHPDFGSGVFGGSPIGIPFNIIPGNQKRAPIRF